MHERAILKFDVHRTHSRSCKSAQSVQRTLQNQHTGTREAGVMQSWHQGHLSYRPFTVKMVHNSGMTVLVESIPLMSGNMPGWATTLYDKQGHAAELRAV